jgi:hypothetical protein
VKRDATGRLFHYYASLTAAPTEQEACKAGYLSLQETHAYRDGWDDFDMAAVPLTRPDLQNLLDQAEDD